MKIFVIIILLFVFCVGAVITVEQKTGKELVDWSSLFEVENGGGDFLTTIKAKLNAVGDKEGFEMPGMSGGEKSSPQTVYKWQDDEGNWHFSQEAPEGKTSETMEVKAANVVDMGGETVAKEGGLKQKFEKIKDQLTGDDDKKDDESTPASFYEKQKESLYKK